MAAPGRLDALADPSPEDDSALPPADDAELRAFVTQLRELATRSNAIGASLDHAEALLELARIDRAMAAARAAGTGGIYELKRAPGRRPRPSREAAGPDPRRRGRVEAARDAQSRYHSRAARSSGSSIGRAFGC